MRNSHPICDKCGCQIPFNANFCPACGDPVTDEDFKQISPINSRIQIKIKFGHSRSSSYGYAVDFASKFPSYAESGKGCQKRHSVAFDVNDIDAAIHLWEMVSGWKSSCLMINNKISSKKDLVYGPLGCYRKRQNDPVPGQYCFYPDSSAQNIWGCFRLGISNEDIFTPWGRFCNYDRKEKILFIDKAAIKQKLGAGFLKLRDCPAFDLKKISIIYEQLPEKINLLKYSGPFREFLETSIQRAEADAQLERYREELKKEKNQHTIYLKAGQRNPNSTNETKQNKNKKITTLWLLVLLLLILFSFISK